MSWKDTLRRDPGGFYRMRTEQGEVRIFMTEALLAEAEEALGAQIENARRFPGVRDAVLTPDAHHGYGVPVGCVMATRPRAAARDDRGLAREQVLAERLEWLHDVSS